MNAFSSLCSVRRILPLLFCLATSMATWPTHGAILLVYNNNDAGAGSLRQAISDNRALGGGNTIVFSNIVTGTITLTSSELMITNDVTIQGPGASVLAISGNNARRVFNLANAKVELAGLRITLGSTNFSGGGISCVGGSLALNDCIVSQNAANSGGGGGIYASTMLAATNCSFVANATSASMSPGSGWGSAIAQNGGSLALANCAFYQNASGSFGTIYFTGSQATLFNCTLAQNSAPIGGGLYVSGGTVLVESCTIFTNRASLYSGGVWKYFDATVTVRNSVIAGNRNFSGAVMPDCYGPFTSGGFNLIGAANDSTGWGALGDQTGVTNSPILPLLNPPADNGGPTYTCKPQPGSPVVDQGKSFGSNKDQRGKPRPYDLPTTPNATGGDGTDIGAFEGSYVLVENDHDSGPGSLRQSIAIAGNPESTIRFASNVVGTITLTSGVLGISKDLTLVGPGAQILTLNGNATTHIFETLAGNVTISGLTLANGRNVGTAGGFEQNGAQARGGGIFNQTTLALNDCILSNNVVAGGAGGPTDFGFAGGGGNGLGGAIANIGTLNLTNCYLAANSAQGGSGGAATSGGSDANGGQGYGGAIYTFGPLTLVRCGLAQNVAAGGAGGGGDGSGSGGGIHNDGNVTLLTCTIASNSATGTPFDFGGGVYHNGSALTVRGSTVCGNQADYGGGFYLGGEADCGNTVLSYNAAGSGPDCSGTIASSDYNLIQNTSGATITGTTTHNLTGQNPLLGALADNGGLSPTMSPLAGSPVIDRGKSLGAVSDQRGAPRPFDFASIVNAAGSDGSDIGAFESGSPPLAIQKGGSASVLSWPSYYGDFTVQSATNIAQSGAWTAEGGSPVVNGNQFLFTNSPVAGNKFYRLKGN